MIFIMIKVFENFSAKFVVSDFAVACIRSSYQCLQMISLRYIVHCKFFMEFIWTHISMSKLLDSITQILLHPVRESICSTQVNIRSVQTPERRHLLIH